MNVVNDTVRSLRVQLAKCTAAKKELENEYRYVVDDSEKEEIEKKLSKIDKDQVQLQLELGSYLKDMDVGC